MPFRTIFGHRRLLHLLSRSIARGTLPQSLIFAGPDGVGKMRTAIAVAQAVNCLKPRIRDQGSGIGGQGSIASSDARLNDELLLDACGECTACRRIERGVFPDVLLIEAEDTGAIKIEQVRAAIGETAFRPFEGRCRVAIIDQADRLGADAQDALLKSLEEPPPRSMFILVSARSDTLAPTIRSRCARLRFGRLSPGEIARALTRDREYSEDTARKLAALAGGSVGRAIEADAGSVDEVRAAACRTLRAVASAADARVRLDGGRELVGERKAGSTAGADRENLAARLTALLSVLRDLVILSTRANGEALANLDLRAELEGLSRFYGRDRAARAFAAADRALWALRRNASTKIVADWLVLQL